MQNLTIDNVVISKTEDNLYRINDLHKASVAGKKKQPSDFLKLVGTQELINEIIGTEQKQALRTIQGGNLEEVVETRKVIRYRFTAAGADYSNGYHHAIPRFEPVQHNIIVKVINAFKKGIEFQNDLFIAKD